MNMVTSQPLSTLKSTILIHLKSWVTLITTPKLVAQPAFLNKKEIMLKIKTVDPLTGVVS